MPSKMDEDRMDMDHFCVSVDANSTSKVATKEEKEGTEEVALDIT